MNKAAAIAAEIPRLRRYARALIGDASAADDLVQDCLVRALANQAQWREGASPRAWLFKILYHLHVDAHRRARRRPLHVEFDETSGSLSSAEGGDDHALDIDDALAGLPDEQRQALLLVALEGLSYAETADVLEVPIGTVMSRISRARDRLRRIYYGNGGGKTRLKRVK
jgi:RNA polymerase sigma-70 factor (ECF subfamily)